MAQAWTYPPDRLQRPPIWTSAEPGRQLKEYRKRAGMKLESVCQPVSRTCEIIRAWELGEAMPSDEEIRSMALLYGTTLAEELDLLELFRSARGRNSFSQLMPRRPDSNRLDAIIVPLARKTSALPALSLKSSVSPLLGPVFLCHSSDDKDQVRALYHRLDKDGVQCWFDEEKLLPGQDWDYEITRAIRASRYVLACLSKASVNKTGYVQKELRKALDVADEQPEGVAFVIPVRLDECDVPERLRHWHWVDLYRPAEYGRLLKVLK